MDTTTTDKLEQMLAGHAVPLQIGELEQIEAEQWNIRTAHNADAIGTRSAPYVGWFSGSLSTSPPDLRIDTETMRASARAGRCHWSKSLRTLPASYRVPMEWASCRKCEQCGLYPPDHPSKLCQGCDAYAAHTAV